MHINDIEQLERDKYTRIHAAMDYSSKSIIGFLDYCQRVIPKKMTILEIGSGTGLFMREMIRAGYTVTGSDITLTGMAKDMRDLSHEFPIWKIPFPDNAFDWVVSCDVMEHIPTDLIPGACREMERVARWGQVHNIATFQGTKFLGYDCHLTVKPIEWWYRRFDFRTNDIHLIERPGGGEFKHMERYVQK